MMNRSQVVLSAAQLEELCSYLGQLGQQADVRCALLADLSGQDIASWESRPGVDMASIAALASGDLMATLEVGRMLGGRRACNLIVQEHDDMTILIGRVGEGMLLLLATARDVPLGWARLALKRASERLQAIIGAAATPHPPAAVSDDFERSFAAQLDSIW